MKYTPNDKFVKDSLDDLTEMLNNHDCHASPDDGCAACEELEEEINYRMYVHGKEKEDDIRMDSAVVKG